MDELKTIPIIITCAGIVCSKPRLVRRREPSEPKLLFEFSIKFRDYVFENLIPDVDDEPTLRKYEDKVRSMIDVDHVYTDKEGVLEQFQEPPSGIWWIELKTISIKVPKQKTLQGSPVEIPE